MTSFRVGDVVHYTSERESRWCREGTAIAIERWGRVVLVDTYWNHLGSEDHVLTDAELATIRPMFNLGDFDELNQYDNGSRTTWEKYAPEDRERTTSQHGLQSRWFIRKGAQPHLPTQIENQREVVERIKSNLESAERQLAYEQNRLAELEASAVSR